MSMLVCLVTSGKTADYQWLDLEDLDQCCQVCLGGTFVDEPFSGALEVPRVQCKFVLLQMQLYPFCIVLRDSLD